jgi:endonuclease YncB( thermonuclease family)
MILPIVILAAATALPVCEGGNRAERGLTCAVDGDTLWIEGEKLRLLDIDTPEKPGHAECEREERLAVEARDRLRELMAMGYQIEWSGESGYYGRELVTITLTDGRDAGEVLIAEGLAQPWPNEGNIWCR